MFVHQEKMKIIYVKKASVPLSLSKNTLYTIKQINIKFISPNEIFQNINFALMQIFI